jgi:hypothetical protein
MRARRNKRTNDGALLADVAESIGTALGSIAAKASAAHKALTGSIAVHRKGAVRKTRNAAENLKRSKLARAKRRGTRRVTSSVKGPARRK